MSPRKKKPRRVPLSEAEREVAASEWGLRPSVQVVAIEQLRLAVEIAALLLDCATATPPTTKEDATLARGYEVSASLLAEAREVVRSVKRLATRG